MPPPKIALTDRSNSRDFSADDWWIPTRGTRLPRGIDDLESRSAALAAVQPAAIFGGSTAAALLGCNVDRPDAEIEALTPRDSAGIRRKGHRRRRRQLLPSHITQVQGLNVTTASRTFVDLAAEFPLPVVVAFGDYAVRHGLASSESISACLADCVGARGIRRARQAADMIDPLAESVPESILRVTLISAGLPTPTPQYVVATDDGSFIARGDLAYVTERVIVEYDGGHHLTPEQQARDADRRHALAMAGWLVVTITAADLRHPQRAIRKVREALSRRRA